MNASGDTSDVFIAGALAVVVALVTVVWGGAAVAAALAGTSFSANLTVAL